MIASTDSVSKTSARWARISSKSARVPGRSMAATLWYFLTSAKRTIGVLPLPSVQTRRVAYFWSASNRDGGGCEAAQAFKAAITAAPEAERRNDERRMVAPEMEDGDRIVVRHPHAGGQCAGATFFDVLARFVDFFPVCKPASL